jgi:hypothetical protein
VGERLAASGVIHNAALTWVVPLASQLGGLRRSSGFSRATTTRNCAKRAVSAQLGRLEPDRGINADRSAIRWRIARSESVSYPCISATERLGSVSVSRPA